MRKRMLAVLLLFGFLGGLLLLGCLPASPRPNQPLGPEYAALDAQVTLTAYAIQQNATQEAANASAAATQGASATAYIQTQSVLDEQYRQATFQAELAGATATQQTLGTATQMWAVGATETAAAQQTLTAEARAQASTSTAQAALNATATLRVEATEQATLARAARTEAIVDGVWRVFWGLVVVAVVILLFLGSTRLFPVLKDYLQAKELQARTIRNDRGQVETLIIEGSRDVRTLFPQRAAGHGLRNTASGIVVDRTPDGPDWQERVTARSQMVDLMEAAMRHQESRKRQAERLWRAALAAGPTNAQLPEGAAEVVEAQVMLLPAATPELVEILADVEDKYNRGDYQ